MHPTSTDTTNRETRTDTTDTEDSSGGRYSVPCHDEKAQVHTGEAVIATVAILAAVMFATQALPVQSLTANSAQQHHVTEQRGVIMTAIQTTHETGGVKETILAWDETEREFTNTGSDAYYTTRAADTPLVNAVDAATRSDAVTFNVNVIYDTATGHATQRVLDTGDAPRNSVTVRYPVTLHEDDALRGGDGPTLGATTSSEFYADDTVPGPVYNHAEIEVVAWRV
jgi:hypothetical protein